MLCVNKIKRRLEKSNTNFMSSRINEVKFLVYYQFKKLSNTKWFIDTVLLTYIFKFIIGYNKKNLKIFRLRLKNKIKRKDLMNYLILITINIRNLLNDVFFVANDIHIKNKMNLF
jgi:hypothetical protein